jgi:hypothetical protein
MALVDYPITALIGGGVRVHRGLSAKRFSRFFTQYWRGSKVWYNAVILGSYLQQS